LDYQITKTNQFYKDFFPINQWRLDYQWHLDFQMINIMVFFK
jgi:hypothetical protein